MYLFYAMPDGYIPMSSDGQITVPSSIKTAYGVHELAKSFLGKRVGRVYLMHTWTQEMCELGPTAFCEYIMRHGIVVACS